MEVSSGSAPEVVVCGGRQAVDLASANSMKYDGLAKFAVDEHNNNQNSLEKLKFSKLVSAHTQVVAGCMYHLVIEAEDQGGQPKQYEARIWEKSWENFKQLVGFTPKGAPEEDVAP